MVMRLSCIVCYKCQLWMSRRKTTMRFDMPLRMDMWPLNGHVAVVDRLLQVPGVDATAQNNAAIRIATRYGHADVVDRLLQVVPAVYVTVDRTELMPIALRCGHVGLVERLLRDERVVTKLGLSSHVAHHVSTRCAEAIARCVAAQLEFRKDVIAAFRMAYECVRCEMYHDMAGQLCEWVWLFPLARQAVEVQRDLMVGLQRLRRYSSNGTSE
eukprot:TRINITY_DN809_c0_g1_i12.p1 TRINITY_DN809_c0_g1~~TRINITY_DN809_c0_g1_i12.p1  ORF type:complete len:213 (+),score=26.36 TRINITY_DN809_c0_g1_i12:294-932(+)